MKSLLLLGVYLLSIVIIYVMFSLVGLVFIDTSYLDILHDPYWRCVYFMFFGWWLAIFPAREYYLINKEYFDRVF